MKLELEGFFQEYEKILADMEKVFNRIQSDFPAEVTCHQGCTDCCYALFDLSLIEAMFLNRKYHELLSGEVRTEVRERADKADRETYKIKRRIYKSRQQGADTEQIMAEVGRERVRCPLLGGDDRCVLYEWRPVTCRLYGLPLSIGGEVHTCSRTGFVPGQKYPTVYMDKIQDRLLELSQKMAASIPSKYTKLGEVLVPLSMALITEYDAEYLGIIEPKDEEKKGDKSGTEWVLGKDN
ncbi:MAG: YkgJ family cysteine cluster protein [Desulfohalobiaceae bacterium]|nr:YkgJ family cysteine cluster protein [Desulfohalobiaceae bacterium]